MNKIVLIFLISLIINNIQGQEVKGDFIDKISDKAGHIITKNKLTILYTQFGLTGSRVNDLYNDLQNVSIDQKVITGRVSSMTFGCLSLMPSVKSRRFSIQYGLAFNHVSVDLINDFDLKIKKGRVEVQDYKSRSLRHSIANRYIQFPLFVSVLMPDYHNSCSGFRSSVNHFLANRNVTIGIIPSFLISSSFERIYEMGERKMSFADDMMNRIKVEASLRFDVTKRVGLFVNYNLRTSFKSSFYTKADRLTTGVNVNIF